MDDPVGGFPAASQLRRREWMQGKAVRSREDHEQLLGASTTAVNRIRKERRGTYSSKELRISSA